MANHIKWKPLPRHPTESSSPSTSKDLLTPPLPFSPPPRPPPLPPNSPPPVFSCSSTPPQLVPPPKHYTGKEDSDEKSDKDANVPIKDAAKWCYYKNSVYEYPLATPQPSHYHQSQYWYPHTYPVPSPLLPAQSTSASHEKTKPSSCPRHYYTNIYVIKPSDNYKTPNKRPSGSSIGNRDESYHNSSTSNACNKLQKAKVIPWTRETQAEMKYALCKNYSKIGKHENHEVHSQKTKYAEKRNCPLERENIESKQHSSLPENRKRLRYSDDLSVRSDCKVFVQSWNSSEHNNVKETIEKQTETLPVETDREMAAKFQTQIPLRANKIKFVLNSNTLSAISKSSSPSNSNTVGKSKSNNETQTAMAEKVNSISTANVEMTNTTSSDEQSTKPKPTTMLLEKLKAIQMEASKVSNKQPQQRCINSTNSSSFNKVDESSDSALRKAIENKWNRAFSPYVNLSLNSKLPHKKLDDSTKQKHPFQMQPKSQQTTNKNVDFVCNKVVRPNICSSSAKVVQTKEDELKIVIKRNCPGLKRALNYDNKDDSTNDDDDDDDVLSPVIKAAKTCNYRILSSSDSEELEEDPSTWKALKELNQNNKTVKVDSVHISDPQPITNIGMPSSELSSNPEDKVVTNYEKNVQNKLEMKPIIRVVKYIGRSETSKSPCLQSVPAKGPLLASPEIEEGEIIDDEDKLPNDSRNLTEKSISSKTQDCRISKTNVDEQSVQNIKQKTTLKDNACKTLLNEDANYTTLPNKDANYNTVLNEITDYNTEPSEDINCTTVPNEDSKNKMVPHEDSNYIMVPKEDTIYKMALNEDNLKITPNEDNNFKMAFKTIKAKTMLSNITQEKTTTSSFQEKTMTSNSIQDKTFSSINIQEKTITNTNIQEKTMTCTNIQEKIMTSTNIQEKTMTSNRIQEKPVSSNDIQEKTVPINDIQQEIMSSNCIHEKAMFSNDTQEKTMPSNDIQEKIIPSNDTLEKTMPSNDIQEKIIPSSDTLEKTMHSNDIQEKIILSNDIQEKTMPSNDIQEKTMYSSDNQEKTVYSSNKQEKMVYSSNNQEKMVYSSNNQDKTASSNDIQDNTASSNNIQEKTAFINNIQEKTGSSNNIKEKMTSINDIKENISFNNDIEENLLSNDVPIGVNNNVDEPITEWVIELNSQPIASKTDQIRNINSKYETAEKLHIKDKDESQKNTLDMFNDDVEVDVETLTSTECQTVMVDEIHKDTTQIFTEDEDKPNQEPEAVSQEVVIDEGEFTVVNIDDTMVLHIEDRQLDESKSRFLNEFLDFLNEEKANTDEISSSTDPTESSETDNDLQNDNKSSTDGPNSPQQSNDLTLEMPDEVESDQTETLEQITSNEMKIDLVEEQNDHQQTDHPIELEPKKTELRNEVQTNPYEVETNPSEVAKPNVPMSDLENISELQQPDERSAFQKTNEIPLKGQSLIILIPAKLTSQIKDVLKPIQSNEKPIKTSQLLGPPYIISTTAQMLSPPTTPPPQPIVEQLSSDAQSSKTWTDMPIIEESSPNTLPDPQTSDENYGQSSRYITRQSNKQVNNYKGNRPTLRSITRAAQRRGVAKPLINVRYDNPVPLEYKQRIKKYMARRIEPRHSSTDAKQTEPIVVGTTQTEALEIPDSTITNTSPKPKTNVENELLPKDTEPVDPQLHTNETNKSGKEFSSEKSSIIEFCQDNVSTTCDLNANIADQVSVSVENVEKAVSNEKNVPQQANDCNLSVVTNIKNSDDKLTNVSTDLNFDKNLESSNDDPSPLPPATCENMPKSMSEFSNDKLKNVETSAPSATTVSEQIVALNRVELPKVSININNINSSTNEIYTDTISNNDQDQEVQILKVCMPNKTKQHRKERNASFESSTLKYGPHWISDQTQNIGADHSGARHHPFLNLRPTVAVNPKLALYSYRENQIHPSIARMTSPSCVPTSVINRYYDTSATSKFPNTLVTEALPHLARMITTSESLRQNKATIVYSNADISVIPLIGNKEIPIRVSQADSVPAASSQHIPPPMAISSPKPAEKSVAVTTTSGSYTPPISANKSTLRMCLQSDIPIANRLNCGATINVVNATQAQMSSVPVSTVTVAGVPIRILPAKTNQQAQSLNLQQQQMHVKIPAQCTQTLACAPQYGEKLNQAAIMNLIEAKRQRLSLRAQAHRYPLPAHQVPHNKVRSAMVLNAAEQLYAKHGLITGQKVIRPPAAHSNLKSKDQPVIGLNTVERIRILQQDRSITCPTPCPLDLSNQPPQQQYSNSVPTSGILCNLLNTNQPKQNVQTTTIQSNTNQSVNTNPKLNIMSPNKISEPPATKSPIVKVGIYSDTKEKEAISMPSQNWQAMQEYEKYFDMKQLYLNYQRQDLLKSKMLQQQQQLLPIQQANLNMHPRLSTISNDIQINANKEKVSSIDPQPKTGFRPLRPVPKPIIPLNASKGHLTSDTRMWKEYEEQYQKILRQNFADYVMQLEKTAERQKNALNNQTITKPDGVERMDYRNYVKDGLINKLPAVSQNESANRSILQDMYVNDVGAYSNQLVKSAQNGSRVIPLPQSQLSLHDPRSIFVIGNEKKVKTADSPLGNYRSSQLNSPNVISPQSHLASLSSQQKPPPLGHISPSSHHSSIVNLRLPPHSDSADQFRQTFHNLGSADQHTNKDLNESSATKSSPVISSNSNSREESEALYRYPKLSYHSYNALECSTSKSSTAMKTNVVMPVPFRPVPVPVQMPRLKPAVDIASTVATSSDQWVNSNKNLHLIMPNDHQHRDVADEQLPSTSNLAVNFLHLPTSPFMPTQLTYSQLWNRYN